MDRLRHHAPLNTPSQLAQVPDRNQRSNAMNTLQLKGNWNILKGKLKQKYANLTDDDLQYLEGKEEELIGRIQKRTGQTKEQVEKALRDCEVCQG
jgi:uncharacterized protein YjbJ (UPF0337 family)